MVIFVYLSCCFQNTDRILYRSFLRPLLLNRRQITSVQRKINNFRMEVIETQIERKRRLARARKQKWLARQSKETLKKIREADALRMAAKRAGVALMSEGNHQISDEGAFQHLHASANETPNETYQKLFFNDSCNQNGSQQKFSHNVVQKTSVSKLNDVKNDVNETPIERKRRLAKARKQKWLARQTLERLQKIRERDPFVMAATAASVAPAESHQVCTKDGSQDLQSPTNVNLKDTYQRLISDVLSFQSSLQQKLFQNGGTMPLLPQLQEQVVPKIFPWLAVQNQLSYIVSGMKNSKPTFSISRKPVSVDETENSTNCVDKLTNDSPNLMKLAEELVKKRTGIIKHPIDINETKIERKRRLARVRKQRWLARQSLDGLKKIRETNVLSLATKRTFEMSEETGRHTAHAYQHSRVGTNESREQTLQGLAVDAACHQCSLLQPRLFPNTGIAPVLLGQPQKEEVSKTLPWTTTSERQLSVLCRQTADKKNLKPSLPTPHKPKLADDPKNAASHLDKPTNVPFGVNAVTAKSVKKEPTIYETNENVILCINETPIERKRRFGRVRRQRWLARQSQESLKKLRETDALRMATKRASETPEERQHRLDTDAQRHSLARANETPEQTHQRRVADACQHSRARACETLGEKEKGHVTDSIHQQSILQPGLFQNPGNMPLFSHLQDCVSPRMHPWQPVESALPGSISKWASGNRNSKPAFPTSHFDESSKWTKNLGEDADYSSSSDTSAGSELIKTDTMHERLNTSVESNIAREIKIEPSDTILEDFSPTYDGTQFPFEAVFIKTQPLDLSLESDDDTDMETIHQMGDPD